MPKIVDHEARRRRILEAAARVFSRRGMEATGLVHVADEAGMSRPALYTYYRDKESLLADMADRLLEREDALIADILAAGDAADLRVERLAVGVVELVFEGADRQGVVLQMWGAMPERVRPMLRSLRGALAEVIREGQAADCIDRDLDPEAGATMVVALLDGVLVQGLLDRERFSDASVARETVRAGVKRLLRPG